MMKNMLTISLVALMMFTFSCKKESHPFESKFPENVNRIWAGPDYWANPLQDWRVSNGRLECRVTAPDRTVHLITRMIDTNGSADFSMETDLGFISNSGVNVSQGWGGFLFGVKGEFDDYRDNAIYGEGVNAGITSEGVLFIENISGHSVPGGTREESKELFHEEGITLQLASEKAGNDEARITLTAFKHGTKKFLDSVSKTLSLETLNGNIALESSFEGDLENPDRTPSLWFDNWNVEGSGIAVFPENKFGPILFTQYTLSKGILKLSAQFPPMSKADPNLAVLELKDQNGQWVKKDEQHIDPMSRSTTFRVKMDEMNRSVPYRVVYHWLPDGHNKKAEYFTGTIKNDPVDKETVTVAAFTGNNDLGYPNKEVTRHVLKQKPDLLVFTGDQIYEPRGRYGYTMEPLNMATLDYLRKWYMFGWEYKKMLRDIPSVSIPDDHDVYHGNIWGCGGKKATYHEDLKVWQDDGGYKLPPQWVNMVQRTQTAHLPDPYDPTPVKQGITVYYCDMHVGGIDFAIIEDRKWKTNPKSALPDYLDIRNGWAENSRYNDPEVFDVEAELLGKRQEKFLNDWADDWSGGTMMKSVISQTIFSTVATLPDSAISDVVVPKLRINKPGEYPENDIPTQDMDSNGWPKKARDQTLKIIRKAFAFHIAGDQHLATTIQYGIDDWGDASYAICVPSISNFYPRRWFPKEGGKNREPGEPKNLGDFKDGFGNFVTVEAVANPRVSGLEPAKLYDRSNGYGIIRFNKETRKISIENWPRHVDPSKPGARPYEGWPVIIRQTDNYGKEAAAWLPTLEITGTDLPPVVKIFKEKDGSLVYALRLKGKKFSPKVFEKGAYRIEAGEPETGKWEKLNNIQTFTQPNQKNIQITL